MLEVADIVRLHSAAYRERPGVSLSSAQKRALRDIAACRTPFFGGHVHQCDRCQEKVFSYHSCGNRTCPKCHQRQTDRWIEKQRGHLLGCCYFLVTFTLPAELRPLARSHPKIVYGLLMKAAADALQKLANDPRYLGARLGALSVLHTWTRAMLLHPHVHMLVTAGGLSADGSWVDSKHPTFLVPVKALSVIFRAKFCAALKKAELLGDVPPSLWKKNWVVHSQHAGRGEKVLDYLGRYVFRIAIANSRLESIVNGQVGFRYRDNRTQQIRHITLPAHEFLDRFLQHVLPPGVVKVRYYGIWSPSQSEQLESARALLAANPPAADSPVLAPPAESDALIPVPPRCPFCSAGVLRLVQTLPSQRGHSP